MLYVGIGAVVLLLFVLAMFIVMQYNRLVRSRLLVREGFSGMDVQLKRRHELIPRLVEVAKGYSQFESKVLNELTTIRGEAIRAQQIQDKARYEGELQNVLSRLLVVVESYPDLKANQQYQELTSALIETEDKLQKSRRYYNGTVRDYNTRIETFPNNMLASLFHFVREEYFEIEDAAERESPKVQL
ncbi:MAG: LemA family protein [Pirellulaceae bacterium]